jgi:transcription antitermination factor NusG
MKQYIVDLNAYVTVEAKTSSEAWEIVNNNPTIIEALNRIREALPLGGDFEIGEPEETK